MSWKDIRVGDYLTVLTDYHANGAYEKLKKNVTLKYEPDYALMIRTLNFERGDFKDDLIYLNEEEYEFLAKSKVKPYDIVMNKIANAGSVYLMPNLGQPVSLAMNLFLLRFDERVDQKFMFYLMKVNEPYIKTFTNGSTTKTITKDAVKNLNFKLPPLPTQQKIASILSAYDDLIENNLKRIALLEKSARLLYEEWFVRLRFPGYEHTKIENGIPEGWKSQTAYESMEIMSGGTPKTSNPNFYDGEIPFYTPKDASDNFYVLETLKTLTEQGLKNCNSKFYPKDTLFITARGTVGKLNLAQQPMAMNQSCYALKGKFYITQKFLYCAMADAVERIKSHAVGSVFDAIVVDTFKMITLNIPTENLVNIFEETIRPVFVQTETLLLQTKKLKQARNLLLPKLINGEIPV
ncbi:restriction endonuclease subunit S [Adhaeribacter sp. BT258]|uniref:Restriction endonuclease subunit S n=1 Tax=Adhaeribacter terrigena TaxID=2793070 RepID=A0ABS1C0X3_9BACT|nr:restriction endonuclease subunit S [Adhaeribacter terrigena]MBK0403059.1 restriction endonuclease subunit S [Adhaeribacter terrigena]